MAEDIDEEQLIDGAILAHAREFRVALPGRITSYDAQKQRAEVELQLSYYVPTTDDQQVAESHPVLKNVPVCFPQGGGGFFVSFPLAKGDPVMVVFCDVPIGAWLAKGAPCEPGVDGMHGLGGAVAFPCGPQPTKSVLQNADASTMRMGKDGDGSAQIEIAPGEVRLGAGADKALALAEKVEQELNLVKAALAGHTHPYMNATTPATTSPSADNSYTSVGSTSSSNAKAKP